ncbi:hypothetical protein QTH91_01210 [Variovorax dokdonensis]|uniref:Uncharacterized protein n=1 Tax=Variovorax dokdonensis TaxID=344883 RepID=A0ABT7N569_9BURK|nr:hypothetical protein [Variovorax dokdonensis]MDM0043089.1 hypothetical protein [Variovorax dokdonensis]
MSQEKNVAIEHISAALRAKGMADVNSGHPNFRVLVDKGVPLDTFEGAADTCMKAAPPKGFN